MLFQLISWQSNLNASVMLICINTYATLLTFPQACLQLKRNEFQSAV